MIIKYKGRDDKNLKTVLKFESKHTFVSNISVQNKNDIKCKPFQVLNLLNP